MTIDVFPNEAVLAATLARRLADKIRAHPDLVLGLPTGRTPLALYAELVAVTRKEGLDWSHVRSFNLDEFVGLSGNDPGSYRAFMQDRLFRHVNIDPSYIGFPNGRARDLKAECERYEQAIADAGGIDVLVLGIGSNGHIGFNEPHDELAARTHHVALEDPSRAGNAVWFDGDLDRVPHEALSMGMATILGAREIDLMATGEAKAEAVRLMVEGGVATRLPASFLQLHPRVAVLLDPAAAARLSNRVAFSS